MTHYLSQKEKAKTLALVRRHLAGIPQLVHHPNARLWVEKLLQEAEALCSEPVDFMLCADGRFCVNGTPVYNFGKGLMQAWLTLAGAQHRQSPLRADWSFSGRHSSASAKQALDRAAEAVKPTSPNLARAIDAIGVHRGELVLKENPQVQVRCTLDDRLLQCFRRRA